VTLGFAELHYRIAALRGDLAAFSKAEAWMELIREVAPDGDALPEQFDRVTGKPVSTRALTWSAAAFVGAAAARERCVGKLFGGNG
jgi:glucoamylase